MAAGLGTALPTIATISGSDVRSRSSRIAIGTRAGANGHLGIVYRWESVMRTLDGESSLPCYRIVFFRDLTNSKGDRYRVSIEEIRIARARSRERALEAALLRFTRRHRLHSWNSLADGYEQHGEAGSIFK